MARVRGGVLGSGLEARIGAHRWRTRPRAIDLNTLKAQSFFRREKAFFFLLQ